jgi:hypothetical protein
MAATLPTFEQVMRYFVEGQIAPDQQKSLIAVWNARIKRERSTRKMEAAGGLRTGLRVSFPVRGGGTATGVIDRVMRTNCWVDSGGRRYYCPATCLTVIP